MKILEIGCGPGALAESLHRWYPKAHITAIDRDSRFISFAKENIPGIDFREADATQLPFEDRSFDITISNTVQEHEDRSFDITISNTVQEHIEQTAFWGEPRRVLKPGGVCLCLSARKGLRCIAPCLETTAAGKDFWENCPSANGELEKYGVCRFPMSEAELPASMERNGFSDVTTGYAIIDLTPDASKYSSQIAETMIEAMRQTDLEAIQSVHSSHAESVIPP